MQQWKALMVAAALAAIITRCYRLPLRVRR